MRPDERTPKESSQTPKESSKTERNLLDDILSAAGLEPKHREYRDARLSLELLTTQLITSAPGVRFNEAFLDEAISGLDAKIGAQVDEILHHPAFQQVESAWRGLKFLVQHTDFRENIEIQYLDAPKDAVLADFRRADNLSDSTLYRIVYDSEYGNFGGRPFAAIIGDYAFGPGDSDFEFLKCTANIAMLAQTPFIAAASPRLLGLETFAELSHDGSPGNEPHGPESVRWNYFRDSEAARYVGLTLPRFLLRAPYSQDDHSGGSFAYREDTSRALDQYLWGNAAFAFATRITDSFAKYHWCPNIIGLEGGGAVENLPVHVRELSGIHEVIGPTDVLIPESRRIELAEAGFIILAAERDGHGACFFEANSCHLAKYRASHEADPGTEFDSRLRSKLPFTFILSRFVQYIKVLHREQVGRFMEPADVERNLQNWLNQYVADYDASPQIRMQRPLRQARIEIQPVDDPRWYRFNIMVQPAFAYRGVPFTLSLVSRLDRGTRLETWFPAGLRGPHPGMHRAKWQITLAVEREGLSKTVIQGIVRELRALTGDDALELESVEPGSVILKLKGSVDGYRVLENLFRSGNLTSLLGLPVEAIAFADSDAVNSVRPPPAPGDQTTPCHVFCSYSHRDSAFREKLERYLRVLERNGLIRTWHDRKLTGGDDWKGQIDANLERADLILLLVSADFLASEYCYDVEMKRALERHNQKQARVVPIIVRPAPWQQTPLANLQVLPQNAKPVSQWPNRDVAFNTITDDLRNIILQMHTN